MSIIDKIKRRYLQFLKMHYPYLWSKYLYKTTLGKVADFSNPRDLNEKIQWLMFFTDTSFWTLLADKYAVREYVRGRIGAKYLIPLLGKWDSAEDINFDLLPEKFVIKPNNGSYDTIICKNKQDIDIDDVRCRLAYSLSHKFGYENAEPHYLKISPCIIAEELLETDEPGGLKDYKIWCFNGNPYCVFICANRDSVNHHADFVYYDLNWCRHNENLTEEYQNCFEFPKPDNFDELLSVASRLAAGLPQVRVDLYCVNGKIYFGEMTLSSNFGMMPYFTSDALVTMGKQVQLPPRNMKEIINTFFKRWFPVI